MHFEKGDVAIPTLISVGRGNTINILFILVVSDGRYDGEALSGGDTCEKWLRLAIQHSLLIKDINGSVTPIAKHIARHHNPAVVEAHTRVIEPDFVFRVGDIGI